VPQDSRPLEPSAFEAEGLTTPEPPKEAKSSRGHLLEPIRAVGEDVSVIYFSKRTMTSRGFQNVYFIVSDMEQT